MKAPPPRLLEDDKAAATLRADLSAAAESESGYDAGAGLARFEANLSASTAADTHAADATPDPAAGSAVLAKSPVSGVALAGEAAPALRAGSAVIVGGQVGSLALKLSAFAIGSALLIGAGWYIAAQRSESTGTGFRRKVDSTLRVPDPVAGSGSEPQQGADEVRARAPAATAPSTPAAQRLVEPSASAARASRVAAQRSEISRLLRARELLRSDPRSALALLRQMERDTPRGVLREEREGLVVLALWNSGEVADKQRARVLARRFLTNYPNSALRQRLRALLDRGHREQP